LSEKNCQIVSVALIAVLGIARFDPAALMRASAASLGGSAPGY
jgi:hypothetical protein